MTKHGSLKQAQSFTIHQFLAEDSDQAQVNSHHSLVMLLKTTKNGLFWDIRLSTTFHITIHRFVVMRVDKVARVFDDPCDVSHMGAGVRSMLAFAGASGHLFKLQQSLLVHADYKKRGESALSHSLLTVRIVNKYSRYVNFCCLGCGWTIFQWTELFLSCQHFSFQCCFMATKTIRLIRDGEPRMATSTFTQLLRSDLVRWWWVDA